jgi:hypothetical protein
MARPYIGTGRLQYRGIISVGHAVHDVSDRRSEYQSVTVIGQSEIARRQTIGERHSTPMGLEAHAIVGQYEVAIGRDDRILREDKSIAVVLDAPVTQSNVLTGVVMQLKPLILRL